MNKKICIGIPCFQSASFEVLDDYMRLAFHLGRRVPEYDFMVAVKGKSEQFRARNAIVTAAIQNACDFLLMLDDDHIIDIDKGTQPTPRYDFVRTLARHLEDDPSKGIVGALYYQRADQPYPVIMDETPDGATFFYHNSEVSGGLQQVKVTGGGCMMINMKVFDRIDQPWFAPEFEFGTDIQVCKSVRKAGWGVWCDTSIDRKSVV